MFAKAGDTDPLNETLLIDPRLSLQTDVYREKEHKSECLPQRRLPMVYESLR